MAIFGGATRKKENFVDILGSSGKSMCQAGVESKKSPQIFFKTTSNAEIFLNGWLIPMASLFSAKVAIDTKDKSQFDILFCQKTKVNNVNLAL